jgi:hypothetical protein
MNYMDTGKSIGLPFNKHFDRIEGVSHSALKKEMHVDIDVPKRCNDLNRAHTGIACIVGMAEQSDTTNNINPTLTLPTTT